MRIIAAFFVVMIHASGLGSFSAVVYNSVARFSVPVFVIISGYYLLTCPPKGTALGKKGLRLFLLMLLWSAVYYGYGLYSGSLTFTGARGLFTYLLTEPVHLWYLYAAIALYLFTPLLYIFCEHAGRRVFLYALTLSFLMGSVVVILLRSGCFPLLTVIVDRAKLPCTLGFLFLFLLGGYLRRYGIPSAVHRRVLYLLGLAGVAVTVLCTWTLPAWGLPQDLLLSFFAPNVLVASAAFFRLCAAGGPARSPTGAQSPGHPPRDGRLYFRNLPSPSAASVGSLFYGGAIPSLRISQSLDPPADGTGLPSGRSFGVRGAKDTGTSADGLKFLRGIHAVSAETLKKGLA